MKTKTIISHGEADTAQAGAALAERLLAEGKARVFIALYGEMGVGKTAFTRGFCSALGIAGVHSPTYTVVNEYLSGKHPVFHFDMYRITDADDLYSIGYDDYLSRDGFALCEWSENIREEIPADALSVTIERTDGENGRRIILEETE
ncbi:MAG: tRNA (adenosine(37)-N6)-threonylcarbamoyltransferase complex ATPase subunit type 1 TsaE [Clostridia bacterium]|nr:tRNA (adenosine(37)-N6)-threonylcarbamoyltransferase complex ATPase subunit type 1 TsaE [Clostridia bacterium]